MHTPEKAKYPSLTLVEVLLSFLKVKQGDNEDLLDYLSRFKSERDVAMRLVGREFLDGYTERLEEYNNLPAGDADAQKTLKKREREKLEAVLFLRNANHDRFGKLLL